MNTEDKFWDSIENINNYLINYCNTNNYKNIIDIGGGDNPFKLSSQVVDVKTYDNNFNYINIDIENEKLPFTDKYFDFCYSRHTLEDLGNPQFSFYEMVRISENGYIETPSPLIEMTENVDSEIFEPHKTYRGYLHHRYFVWTTKKTNTLNFLPKYPIIEKCNITLIEKIKELINIGEFWNNYYFWDKDNLPEIKMYRNGIDFELYNESYYNLLLKSIYESIENTEYIIINKLNNIITYKSHKINDL